jgi:hypothetical protein
MKSRTRELSLEFTSRTFWTSEGSFPRIAVDKLVEYCCFNEAYSLANSGDNDSYSKECIDILCEALSNHKDDLMVIIAGYEEELKETFFKVNKGMYSRFIWRFNVDSYNPTQLMNIFKKKIVDQEWSLENDTILNEKWFEDKKKDEKIGNKEGGKTGNK